MIRYYDGVRLSQRYLISGRIGRWGVSGVSGHIAHIPGSCGSMCRLRACVGLRRSGPLRAVRLRGHVALRRLGSRGSAVPHQPVLVSAHFAVLGGPGGFVPRRGGA